MRVLPPVLLAALTPLGLLAQTPLPVVPVSVYCFRYAPQLETVHLRSAATAYQKIELSTANIVGPQGAVVENGDVTFHRQATAPDGTATWPPVARVRLPANCPRALVLLLPAPEGEALPYRGLAFAHTDKDFPPGSMKMVNLAPYAVRGFVDRSTVTIRPGSVETFRPRGEPGASVPVLFEFRNGEQWQRMTATRWTIRDDRRSLMCIFQDPATKRMNLRSIPDRTTLPATR
jgi:hypothetical protein